jgi:hypothetical protein
MAKMTEKELADRMNALEKFFNLSNEKHSGVLTYFLLGKLMELIFNCDDPDIAYEALIESINKSFEGTKAIRKKQE